MLIEAAWRMFGFQPDYKPILKWKEKMRDCVPTAARRKKMGYPTSYAAKAALEGRVSKIYA